MVNSPSRPDLQAPAPVECGGLTPLWHRETCLPVDRAAMSAPSPSSVPTCPNETRKPVTETRFSKQSNQIKPNQTIPALVRLVCVVRGSHSPGFSISEIRDPDPIPHPNQGKTPCNRASSRQIKANAVFSNSPTFGQPTRWMGRTGSRKVETCAKVLPLRGGEGRGEGERHHQSIPVCSHTQPIKAKTPAIKANQASSRQP